jgi:hypothetical protein
VPSRETNAKAIKNGILGAAESARTELPAVLREVIRDAEQRIGATGANKTDREGTMHA